MVVRLKPARRMRPLLAVTAAVRITRSRPLLVMPPPLLVAYLLNATAGLLYGLSPRLVALPVVMPLLMAPLK